MHMKHRAVHKGQVLNRADLTQITDPIQIIVKIQNHLKGIEVKEIFKTMN